MKLSEVITLCRASAEDLKELNQWLSQAALEYLADNPTKSLVDFWHEKCIEEEE